MRPSRILPIVIALAVLAVVVLAMRGSAVTVEIEAVARGTVRRIVTEEGKTRVAERYVLSAPVAGRLLRVEIEEGDRVEAGAVVARIEDLPLAAAVTAAKARIDATLARLAGVQRLRPKPEELLRAEAEVARATEAEALAQREREEAKAAFEQATRDAGRARGLFEDKTIPASEKEDAELGEVRARAALHATESMVGVRRVEIRIAELSATILRESAKDVDWQEDQAKADLEAARAELSVVKEDRARAEIKAPATGQVLRRFQESQAVVAAGTPILELGDLANLEVEADLLSEDAARMTPGLRAEVFGRALGDRVLPGRLDRIYPAAFTKISSLGVEQQRTNVIVTLDARPESIGDRYRVDVRIILEEKEGALIVPEAALFRTGGDWNVFRVVDGRARKTKVDSGIRDGRVREVLGGLAEDDRVVLFPPDDLEDGDRVEAP